MGVRGAGQGVDGKGPYEPGDRLDDVTVLRGVVLEVPEPAGRRQLAVMG